jgi:hypothetical protein
MNSTIGRSNVADEGWRQKVTWIVVGAAVALPGTWDRVDLTLENVSKQAAGNAVTVRILATSPPVKYAPTESKMFFRMAPDKLCHLEDESESYAYDLGNDPKTYQLHDITVLCSVIYPGEQRHFAIQFMPPADQSDEAPNAPSAIRVSVKYVGYSLELLFKPKGGAPCGVARKYGGRFSQEECYAVASPSDSE